MPIIPFRMITTNPHPFRFTYRQPNLFSLNTNNNINIISIVHKTMADQSKNTELLTTSDAGRSNDEKEKDLEKSTVNPPPPPEKPLPGDCCGSGCVRCVWDVYYEELEDYNALCKAKPS